MRAFCGQTVLKFPSPDAPSFEDALARARDFIVRWKGAPLDRPRPRPARPIHLHAGDPAQLRGAGRGVRRPAPHPPRRDAARRSRTRAPPTACRSSPGSRSRGSSTRKVLAAHCVHVDEGEIRALKNSGAGRFAQPDQQPEARRRHGPGRADARAGRGRRHRHRRRRPRTTISTCSRRCGWRRCSPKAYGGDPTALPARQALAMATRLGARALHMADVTGSLEPGKRADLIVARSRTRCTTSPPSSAIPTRSTPASSMPRNRPTSST